MSAGKPGSQGGDAGQGGIGGVGGYPGGYALIEFGNREIKKVFLEANSDHGLKGENGVAGGPGLGGLYGATASETKKSEKAKRSVQRERRGSREPEIRTETVYVPKLEYVYVPTFINTNIVRNMIASTKRAPPGNNPSTFNSKDLKFPDEFEKMSIRPIFENYLIHFSFMSNKIKIQNLIDKSLFEKINDTTNLSELLESYENMPSN